MSRSPIRDAVESKDGAVVAAGCVVGGALIALLAFIRGWALMLLLGAVHTYASSVPPISFWPCVGLSLAAGLVLGGTRRTARGNG